MTNPLRELEALGQSVWLDDIDRGQLRSGLFERLIEVDGLSGATGNPTIFEHSITHDTTYDEQMQQLLKEGKGPKEIYEALAMTDERTVADLLRPVVAGQYPRGVAAAVLLSLEAARASDDTGACGAVMDLLAVTDDVQPDRAGAVSVR